MAPPTTTISQQTIADPEASDYDSSADSDFAGSLSASSSDSETGTKGKKRKGRPGEVDSGDEGVIQEASKKKRKTKGGKDAEIDGEGVGMRVRRRREGGGGGKEKKPTLNAEAATVDVDELWAKMNSGPKTPTATEKRETIRGTSKEPSDYSVASALDKSSNGTIRPIATSEGPVTRSDAEDMISIKRTYIFAGETITESKLVPKSSAEARLHLQSQSPAPNMSTQKPALRRPKKRTSMFDTKPPDSPSTATPSAAGTLSAGPKLNTVEKSKLDWAGYVDKEGIKDELDGAEKAKEGYLGKMDFLGRMGAKREEEIKGTKGI